MYYTAFLVTSTELASVFLSVFLSYFVVSLAPIILPSVVHTPTSIHCTHYDRLAIRHLFGILNKSMYVRIGPRWSEAYKGHAMSEVATHVMAIIICF